jgi:hypothetical protein
MAGSFNMKEQGRLQGLGIFWGFFLAFCSVWSDYDLIIIIF